MEEYSYLAGFSWFNPLSVTPNLPTISVDSLITSSVQIGAIQNAFVKSGLANAPVSLESLAQAYSTKGDLFLGYLTDSLAASYGLTLSEVLKDQARKALRTVLEQAIQKANEALQKQGKAPIQVPTVSNTTTNTPVEITDYKPYLFGGIVVILMVGLYGWIKRLN